jgi:hypothetical protein
MPLVHVCWILKDGPKGVRVSAASEARRKNESLPLHQIKAPCQTRGGALWPLPNSIVRDNMV